MLKRVWGAESNGKLPHSFIPSKLQHWFLNFQRKTCLGVELQPWCLSLQNCPWTEHSDDDDDDDDDIIIESRDAETYDIISSLVLRNIRLLRFIFEDGLL